MHWPYPPSLHNALWALPHTSWASATMHGPHHSGPGAPPASQLDRPGLPWTPSPLLGMCPRGLLHVPGRVWGPGPRGTSWCRPGCWLHLLGPVFHPDPGGHHCCPRDIVGISQWLPRKAPRLDGLERSPAGPVSPATACSPWSLCSVYLLPEPGPAFPLPPLFFLSSAVSPPTPLSSLSLLSPGASSPQHPCPTQPLGTGWCRPWVQTHKPQCSVCRVWWAGGTCKHAKPRWQRGPRSSPHRPRRLARPWPWQQQGRGDGANPVPLSHPRRLPRRLEAAKRAWQTSPQAGPWGRAPRTLGTTVPSGHEAGGADAANCPAVPGPQPLAHSPTTDPCDGCLLAKAASPNLSAGGSWEDSPASWGETWASPDSL